MNDTRSHGCEHCNEVFTYAHDRDVHQERAHPPALKPPFPREIWAAIAPTLTDAPLTQVSEAVRDHIRKFAAASAAATDREIFDFMDGVSREPCPLVISSFIQKLFDVRRYYVEPQP